MFRHELNLQTGEGVIINQIPYKDAGNVMHLLDEGYSPLLGWVEITEDEFRSSQTPVLKPVQVMAREFRPSETDAFIMIGEIKKLAVATGILLSPEAIKMIVRYDETQGVG